MTDRSAPGPQKSPTAGRTATRTVQTRSSLDAEQEKVIRMRHGFAVPDDLRLAQKSDGLPDHVLQELRAIEQRAFEASGRYAEMAAEAGVDLAAPEPDTRPGVKKKIIDRLKKPSGD